MKRESLENFYCNQVRQFRDTINQIQVSPAREAIHKIRLNVKRMRTLKDVFCFIDSGRFFDEDLKSLTTIYKKIGEIREIQVTKGLIRELIQDYSLQFDELIIFLNDLEKEKTARLKSLNFQSNDFSELDSFFRKIQETLQQISDQQLTSILTNDFIQSRLNLFQGLTQELENEESWHTVRTHIKRLFFLLEFLKKEPVNSLVIKNQRKLVRKIEAGLGRWHDRVIMLNLIGEFLKNEKYIHFADNCNLFLIQKVLCREKRLFLEQSVSLVEDLLNQYHTSENINPYQD
ncbi:MAG: CHAD domain-containing protein [Bacteroidetes bacterium]|nr:CHAD domain-containing protein [Bacteroidota bacterium]